MKRLSLTAALVLSAAFSALTSSPALATDMINMTETERDVFQAEVRAYLLQNPEVLLEVIAILDTREAEAETVNDTALLLENVDEIYNDGVSYVGGNPDGDITIVEFSDYRCPYCQKAHPEVEKLVTMDGNIKLIYKEFPILGPDSLTTAKFALATLMVSGPEAYETVSAALMELRGPPSIESLMKMADGIGLDAAALQIKMDSSEVLQALQANRALGQSLKISGTPTFIVGDQVVRGYLPLDNMQEIVEQAREAAAKD